LKHDKKTYEAPKLEAHGTVEDLTQHGGGDFADVPRGDAPVNHHVTATHP